jgi:hypothetical protein
VKQYNAFFPVIIYNSLGGLTIIFNSTGQIVGFTKLLIELNYELVYSNSIEMMKQRRPHALRFLEDDTVHVGLAAHQSGVPSNQEVDCD